MFDAASLGNTFGRLMLLLCSALPLLARDRRVGVSAMAVQYVCLAQLSLSLIGRQWALALVIEGVCTAAILAVTAGQIGWRNTPSAPPWPFRMGATVAMMLAVVYVADQPESIWPGLSPAAVMAGYALMALGLLKLGMTADPLETAIGLLMTLNGFRLIYVVGEQSLLLAALMAAVNLSLSVALSYIAVTGERVAE